MHDVPPAGLRQIDEPASKIRYNEVQGLLRFLTFLFRRTDTLMPHADSSKPDSQSRQSLRDLGHQLRSGWLTCESLLRQCRDRYEHWEPEVHAWVQIDWEAGLASARERDKQLADGLDLGPLHGVLVGIKDIIDVKEMVTAAGAGLWRDCVADKDAAVVQRLEEAGAIVCGKTVTTQHASFDPPPTRNPWNTAHTPGGSSSGSAAAVASAMCLAAIGSQTGGSINRPASYCGIAGFKPTFDTVSCEGVRPLSPSLDHIGPMAASVEDLIVCMSVIAESATDRQRFAQLLDESDISGTTPRLAWCGDFLQEKVSPELANLLNDRVGHWRKAVHFHPWQFPDGFEGQVLQIHRTIMAYEAAQVHRELFEQHADDYQPHIRLLIEEGTKVSPSAYEQALAWKEQMGELLTQQFEQSGLDGLLLPATTGAAPDASTTGDPSFNSPWSLTGMPAVSFPIGFSDRGLPLAAQIVGRRGGDVQVLRCARFLEAIDKR